MPTQRTSPEVLMLPSPLTKQVNSGRSTFITSSQSSPVQDFTFINKPIFDDDDLYNTLIPNSLKTLKAFKNNVISSFIKLIKTFNSNTTIASLYDDLVKLSDLSPKRKLKNNFL